MHYVPKQRNKTEIILGINLLVESRQHKTRLSSAISFVLKCRSYVQLTRGVRARVASFPLVCCFQILRFKLRATLKGYRGYCFAHAHLFFSFHIRTVFFYYSNIIFLWQLQRFSIHVKYLQFSYCERVSLAQKFSKKI